MPPTTRKAASRSGNPNRRAQQAAEEDKYAPTVWLNSGIGGMEDVLLPSGQLVLVRRPGVEGLVKAGVLKDLDSLTALVNEKHVKRVESHGKAETQIDMEAMLNDEDQMANINHVVNKVLCYCVVKPPIQMTPDDVTNRKPGVVYADMVDLLDKMYVFQFVVGGTRDLESFRGELNELLGGVASQPDVSAGPE